MVHIRTNTDTNTDSRERYAGLRHSGKGGCWCKGQFRQENKVTVHLQKMRIMNGVQSKCSISSMKRNCRNKELKRILDIDKEGFCM